MKIVLFRKNGNICFSDLETIWSCPGPIDYDYSYNTMFTKANWTKAALPHWCVDIKYLREFTAAAYGIQKACIHTEFGYDAIWNNMR